MLISLKQLLVLCKCKRPIKSSDRIKSYKPSEAPCEFGLCQFDLCEFDLCEECYPQNQATGKSYGEKTILYEDILRATKKFSSRFSIWDSSCFGSRRTRTFYRGTLDNGVKVSVERLGGVVLHHSIIPVELQVLSQISHPHIISLIGYSIGDDEVAEKTSRPCGPRNITLVFEDLEKATLRDHLYVSHGNSATHSPRSKLSWEQRLQICVNLADALNYLHSGGKWRIIHLSVKSTSILLDEDYIAKLANFYKSVVKTSYQLFENGGGGGNTGYEDPDRGWSEKSDVNSFGVLLLEVLCARPPYMVSADQKKERYLADWGIDWQKKGQIAKIVDPVLVGSINSRSLRVYGQTAEKCLKFKSCKRPSMREVLWNLGLAMELQQAGTDGDWGEALSDVEGDPSLEMRYQNAMQSEVFSPIIHGR